MTVKNISLEMIDPNPWQSRSTEDESHIAELAKSIKEDGLLQIPSGRQVEVNNQVRVQLAFGHSRLAAYKLLGIAGITRFMDFPVNLVDFTDEQMAIAAFSENEKRKDLDPVERAQAVQRMIDGFSWDQTQIAEKLHIDRSTVSNMLRMLRMPAEVLDGIKAGIISQRLAMALLPWYELTEVELAIVLSKDPGAQDFIAVARTGQMTNSDLVRKHVDELIALSKPDAPQQAGWINESVQEPVQEVVSEDVQEIPQESTPSEDDDEETGVDEEDELPTEPADAKKAKTPAKKPVTPEHKPTPEPKPVSAVMKGETLITIKVMANGSAFIGTQKFGALFPTFTTTAKFNVDDLPGILKGMGI